VGDVVVGAVGIDREDQVDLAPVDDVGDPGVVPVAVDQPAHDPDDHLDAHVLVGVVTTVEQHLRLGLIRADVVRDLHRPQFAAQVAPADAEPPGDGRVRVSHGLGQRRDLGVGVVALVALGELGPR
jgi:hypothetical protein